MPPEPPRPGKDPAAGRWASVFVAATLAGVPLAIAPGIVLEHDVTPKLAVLLCATAGLLLCWRDWLPGVTRLTAGSTGRLFVILVAAEAASLGLSTALARHPALSLAGTPWRRFGMVSQVALAVWGLLCAAYLKQHPTALRSLFATVAAAAAVLSGYAIAQYAGWDPLLERRLYTIEYGGALVRVPATMGHAVYLGSFLAASLPFSWIYWRRLRQRTALAWMALALSLAAIVLTGARSAILAAGAAAVVWMVSGREWNRRRLLAAGGVLGALMLGAGLFQSLDAGASFHRRLVQLRQDYYGGPRLLVWRDSLPLVRERPLAGWGPESFTGEFRRRESAELARAYPEFTQESPHNLLLEAATAQGLPGLVILLGLAYVIWTGGGSSRDPLRTAAKASGAATLLSLLFLSLTVAGVLMLYTAAACVLAGGLDAPASHPQRVPPGARPAAVVLAGLLVTAAGCYLVKDAATLRAGKRAAAGMFEESWQAYRVSTSLWFPQPGDDLWCSRQLAALARRLTAVPAQRAWLAALAASRRAEETGGNPADAAYQSALLAASLGDAAMCERKVREAIDLAPNWYKPHLLLAQLLRATGRGGESAPEAQKARDLAGELRAAIDRTLGQ